MDIDTFLEIYSLKDETRTGWQLRKVQDPESVADHSWGVAFLSINFAPEELDLEKILKLAIFHDVAEAEVGDIAKRAVDAETRVTDEEKERLEKRAVEKYSDILGSEIQDCWDEYQERNSDESKFVKDMDLIDMCLQALKYEKESRYDSGERNENFQEYDNMDEFFATAEPRLNTETGRKLFEEIRDRYEEVKSSRQ